MEKNIKLILPVTIMVVLVVIVVILGNMYLDYKFPYSCNIGKSEVAGDYQDHGWKAFQIPAGSKTVHYCPEHQEEMKKDMEYRLLNSRKCVKENEVNK